MSSHLRYFDEIGLTAAERDAKIAKYRAQGWSLRAIGRAVGMSPGGVCRALERIADGRGPGRVRA